MPLAKTLEEISLEEGYDDSHVDVRRGWECAAVKTALLLKPGRGMVGWSLRSVR